MSLTVAWDTMWAPFTPRAWVFLFGSIGAVVPLRNLISLTFTRPWQFRRLISNIFGDYESVSQLQFIGDLKSSGNVTLTTYSSPNGQRLATLKRLNNNWANAA